MKLIYKSFFHGVPVYLSIVNFSVIFTMVFILVWIYSLWFSWEQAKKWYVIQTHIVRL